MCYPKPGPRCSGHALERLDRATRTAAAAPDNKNAQLGMLEAQDDFDATPSGLIQLEVRYRKAEAAADETGREVVEQLAGRLAAATARRDTQIAAWRAQTGKDPSRVSAKIQGPRDDNPGPATVVFGDHAARTVRRVLNDHHTDDDGNRLPVGGLVLPQVETGGTVLGHLERAVLRQALTDAARTVPATGGRTPAQRDAQKHLDGIRAATAALDAPDVTDPPAVATPAAEPPATAPPRPALKAANPGKDRAWPAGRTVEYAPNTFPKGSRSKQQEVWVDGRPVGVVESFPDDDARRSAGIGGGVRRSGPTPMRWRSRRSGRSAQFRDRRYTNQADAARALVDDVLHDQRLDPTVRT